MAINSFNPSITVEELVSQAEDRQPLVGLYIDIATHLNRSNYKEVYAYFDASRLCVVLEIGFYRNVKLFITAEKLVDNTPALCNIPCENMDFNNFEKGPNLELYLCVSANDPATTKHFYWSKQYYWVPLNYLKNWLADFLDEIYGELFTEAV